jgi:transposase
MFYSAIGVKVYLKVGYTDLRKSVNGLSIIVSEVLNKDPFSGHLFVFCNRTKKIMKVLYWDRSGYCLWYKKLEKNRFRWPQSHGEVLEISSREFVWLLEGLEINQKGAHKPLNYKYLY